MLKTIKTATSALSYSPHGPPSPFTADCCTVSLEPFRLDLLLARGRSLRGLGCWARGRGLREHRPRYYRPRCAAVLFLTGSGSGSGSVSLATQATQHPTSPRFAQQQWAPTCRLHFGHRNRLRGLCLQTKQIALAMLATSGSDKPSTRPGNGTREVGNGHQPQPQTRWRARKRAPSSPLPPKRFRTNRKQADTTTAKCRLPRWMAPVRRLQPDVSTTPDPNRVALPKTLPTSRSCEAAGSRRADPAASDPGASERAMFSNLNQTPDTMYYYFYHTQAT
jgi:hypothetical protein